MPVLIVAGKLQNLILFNRKFDFVLAVGKGLFYIINCLI